MRTINEEEFVMASMSSLSGGNCMCSCPSGTGSAGSGGYGGSGASTFGCSSGGGGVYECTKCCAQAPCEPNSEEVSNNGNKIKKTPKQQTKLREIKTMKKNNLIGEEIERAKQLWGYDTNKTIL